MTVHGNAKEQYGMDNRWYYEALLARDITHRDRKFLLAQLAKEHEVHLYSPAVCGIPEGIQVHGVVDGNTIASKIYRLSKINLNITLRSIETGIPMRVFDVLSAGGFLISNYQEELAELFLPDREIVLFQTVEELKEKVDYYLHHEEERLKIALAGYRKVAEHYSYPKVLEEIIRIVEGKG